MTADKLDLKIGELLVAAEILTERDLNEAINTAKNTGLPVGRVLIMAGFCSEKEFQAALNAQSLVRDSLVPLDLAVNALNLLATQGLNFDEALQEIGWIPSEDKESNRLGELLLAAEIVPEDQLETAMRTSKATGLPLGRLLISLGILSDEVLATALNAQILIRSGRIERKQAISGLRASHQRRKPFDAELNEKGFYRGPYRPTVRIGELLVLGGALPEEHVLSSLEESLKQEKSVGAILVQKQLITKRVLNLGLTLQEMVSNETITIEQAAELLKTLKDSRLTLEEALAKLEVPAADLRTNVRFHEVLRIAGVISHSDAEKLGVPLEAKPGSKDAMRTADILVRNSFIDHKTSYGALRCYYLICTGWLSMQQGIIALNNFFHKSSSFDEVLDDLKWTFRTNFREEEGEDEGR